MSGDVLGCPRRSGRCCWYLMGRGRGAAEHPTVHRAALHWDHSAQNVTSAEVGKPQGQGGGRGLC